MLSHGPAYLVGVKLKRIHRRTRRMYGRNGPREECALSDSEWLIGIDNKSVTKTEIRLIAGERGAAGVQGMTESTGRWPLGVRC